MPKISVISPVYNVEPYLKRCIESLINQTMSDIEFIFVDDCSTDDSLKVLREYEKKDDRIKVIALEENQGAAVARNKGLEVAKGEYLGFVDPDDSVDLNFYEKLYKKAKEEDADIVKCEHRAYRLDGTVSLSKLNEVIKEKGKWYFRGQWQSAIYRSSFVFENNIKFPPEIRKAQDTVFLERVVLKSNKIALLNGVYYNYFQRVGSLNYLKIPIKHIKSALNAVTIICNDYNKSNLYEENKDIYMELYSKRVIGIMLRTLFQNDSYEAKRLCAEKVLELYYKCKDIEGLNKLIPNKKIAKLLKQNNVDKLTKELCRYESKKQIIAPYSWYQRIFSSRNNEHHKIITILGFRIKIKR